MVAALLGPVFATGLVLVGVTFWVRRSDPARFKSWIANQVKQATGRDFAIDGQLDLRLGRKTLLFFTDARMSNAEGARHPEMIKIGRCEIEVDITALLLGRFKLERLLLRDVVVQLEESADGKGNWQFAPTEESPNPKPEKKRQFDISVAQLRWDVVRIEFHRPIWPNPAVYDFRYLEAEIASLDKPVVIDLDMNWSGRPITAKGQIGAARQMLSGQALLMDLVVGSNGATLKTKGWLRGLNLDVEAELHGRSMSELDMISGLSFPNSSHYRISAHLTGNLSEQLQLANAKAKVGESDLAGHLLADYSGKRLIFTGELDAERWDFADLLGREQSTGTLDEPKRRPTRQKQILPAAPLPYGFITPLDVVAKIRAGHLTLAGYDYHNVTLEGGFENGKLKLKPLQALVAGGHLDVQVTADAKKRTFNIKGKAKQVDLALFLTSIGRRDDMLEGLVDLEIDLKGKGETIKSWLGAVSGKVNWQMQSGVIAQRYVDWLGRDLRRALPLLHELAASNSRFKNFSSPWVIVQGHAQTELTELDTELVQATMEGIIDLKSEKLNLMIKTRSQDIAIAMGPPVKITGTFANPILTPDAATLAVDGAKTAIDVATGVAQGGLNVFLPIMEAATNELHAAATGKKVKPVRAVENAVDGAVKGFEKSLKNFFK